MALIPDIDRVKILDDCFNIDVGLFYGCNLGLDSRFLIALFCNGTGLIITFGFFLYTFD